MIDEIFDGVFSGFQKLLVLYIGYILFSTGKHLVSSTRIFNERTRGMTRWKAAMITPIVGVVLGCLAATPSTIREGGDPLFGGGEVVDVIEVDKPYKTFSSVFVFACVAMWFGVAKTEAKKVSG